MSAIAGNNNAVTQPYSLRNLRPETVRVAVVASQWNAQITDVLAQDAVQAFIRAGVKEEHVELIRVPGAFELIYAASRLVQRGGYNAVVVLGCVIRGATSHYDLICNSVAQGMTELNLLGKCPVIFGLVTTENELQARERTFGPVEHKGTDSAVTALRMMDLPYRG